MRGAPDPAEPSNPGETRASGSGPPGTADLGAVRRTDAVIDSLAARRAAGSAAGSAARPHPGTETGRPRQAEESDPAVRLLRALIDDVDDPGCGSEAAPPPPPPSGPGPRRRGPRTIVALGVAGAVLASTGVAAAGSVADRATSAAPAPRPSAGTPGDAEPSARTDTDAGTYERPQPSALPPRPSPEPERAGPSTTPAETPEHRESERPRTRYPFPFGPRSPHPDYPATTVSAPASETESPTPERRRDLQKYEDRRRHSDKDPHRRYYD
ncbi:hypothetical protein [Actinomadura livida]|nr:MULTISPECIES: hypothetical protein [Actinomadura]MBB4778158.1 hypothetical protein [Actinomadura catellatispora]